MTIFVILMPALLGPALFAFVAGKPILNVACIKSSDAIQINSGSENVMNRLAEGVFVTCKDHVTNETWNFDVFMENEHLKVRGPRHLEAEAKMAKQKIQIYLGQSADEMENSHCHLQIGEARPFKCENQKQDEEDQTGVIVGGTLGIGGLLILVIIVVVVFLRRRASGHSGLLSRSTTADSGAVANQEEREMEPLQDKQKVNNGSGREQCQRDPLTQPGGSGPMESSDVRAGNGVGPQTVRINHDAAGEFAHQPEAVAAVGRRRMTRFAACQTC